MSSSIQDASKKTSFEIFNRIAKSYDSVNRILSFGLDIGWRKKVNTLLPQKESLRLLDLYTGTADQVIMLCDINPNIGSATGMDLSDEMLNIGREKIKRFNGKISCTMVMLYNFQSKMLNMTPSQCLLELEMFQMFQRVCERCIVFSEMEEKALILEFSLPKNPIVRFGHLFYLRYVLPFVGGLISGDYAAYKYLNTSIEAFPYGEDFCNLMRNAGFESVTAHPVTFGLLRYMKRVNNR